MGCKDVLAKVAFPKKREPLEWTAKEHNYIANGRTSEVLEALWVQFFLYIDLRKPFHILITEVMKQHWETTSYILLMCVTIKCVLQLSALVGTRGKLISKSLLCCSFEKESLVMGIGLFFALFVGSGFFFSLRSSVVSQHLGTNYKLTVSLFIISRTAENVWFVSCRRELEMRTYVRKVIPIRLRGCLAQYPASKPEAGALFPLIARKMPECPWEHKQLHVSGLNFETMQESPWNLCQSSGVLWLTVHCWKSQPSTCPVSPWIPANVLHP